jgi:hypothetical protein
LNVFDAPARFAEPFLFNRRFKYRGNPASSLSGASMIRKKRTTLDLKQKCAPS